MFDIPSWRWCWLQRGFLQNRHSSFDSLKFIVLELYGSAYLVRARHLTEMRRGRRFTQYWLRSWKWARIKTSTFETKGMIQLFYILMYFLVWASENLLLFETGVCGAFCKKLLRWRASSSNQLVPFSETKINTRTTLFTLAHETAPQVRGGFEKKHRLPFIPFSDFRFSITPPPPASVLNACHPMLYRNEYLL